MGCLLKKKKKKDKGCHLLSIKGVKYLNSIIHEKPYVIFIPLLEMRKLSFRTFNKSFLLPLYHNAPWKIFIIVFCCPALKSL